MNIHGQAAQPFQIDAVKDFAFAGDLADLGMLLLISQIDGLGNFPLLVTLGRVLTVFSATQHIATDAITCRLLPAESRGIGNSIQVAGGLIGIMPGGGATLSLYSQIGWTGCFLLMAVVHELLDCYSIADLADRSSASAVELKTGLNLPMTQGKRLASAEICS